MSRPISRKRAPGSRSLRDALARGQLAGVVLLRDFGGAAARAQALFEFVELFDQMAHVRGAGDGGVGNGRLVGAMLFYCSTNGMLR